MVDDQHGCNGLDDGRPIHEGDVAPFRQAVLERSHDLTKAHYFSAIFVLALVYSVHRTQHQWFGDSMTSKRDWPGSRTRTALNFAARSRRRRVRT